VLLIKLKKFKEWPFRETKNENTSFSDFFLLLITSYSAAAELTEKAWLEPSVDQIQRQLLTLPPEERTEWLLAQSSQISESGLAQFQYRQLLADNYDFNDDLDQFGVIVRELERDFSQVAQLETRVEFLIQLGFLEYLESFGGCDSYQQAYALSRSSTLADIRVRAASKHAYCLILRLSTLIEALSVLTEALDEANENALPHRRKALLLSSLSQTYSRLLMYDEGKRANDESIRLFAEDESFADVVSGVYTGITSALHFSYFDDAAEYLDELNELRIRNESSSEVAFYYYQLRGEFLIRQQDPDYVAALESLDKAREFEGSVPERYLVALNLTNLLSALIGAGEMERARSWLAELMVHPEFSEEELFAGRGPQLAKLIIEQNMAQAWRLTNQIVTDQHRAYYERFKVLRSSEALDNQNLADRYLVNLHEQEIELERVRADVEAAKNLVASRNQQLLVIALLFIAMIMVYSVISRRTFKRLAHTDGLSRLMNRRAILQLVESRYGKKLPTALALIDIDHFKRVNDSYGHSVGDQVIREVARLLQLSLKPTDRIGRYGGEEFLLVASLNEGDDVQLLTDELRRKIAEADFASMEESVTISIGGAVMNFNHPSDDTIVKADEALYQAKQNGRNQSVWSSP
jgi:diguanylate cyclase (GGDEF)-like protein